MASISLCTKRRPWTLDVSIEVEQVDGRFAACGQHLICEQNGQGVKSPFNQQRRQTSTDRARYPPVSSQLTFDAFSSK
jgi:hypothetical protein